MEGLNVGGILLAFLAVLVAVGGCLVALGLAIARLTNAARICSAAGLLSAAALGAYSAITFLHDSPDGKATVLPALILLLAGTGQFVAAMFNPRMYRVALACGAGSFVFLCTPLLESDGGQTLVPGARFLIPVLAAPSLILPGVTVALALGLLLALLSLIVAAVPSRRSNAALVQMQLCDPAPSTDKIKSA